MNGSPLVSVVIPVHNGEKTIAACLQSVSDSDYRHFEVIVVDDGSTDRTADRTKAFPCQVVRLRANLGPAAARNKGAEASRGGILFFLDADIVIERSTITRIVQVFNDRPSLSALFCSYHKNTIPTNFASVYKNLLHHYTHQTSREDAATFCGGFGAIRKDALVQLGGFNEDYKHLEDIELGYRLYRAGHKIRLTKDIQVTHCKQYSLLGLIQSDLMGRAKPWTEIMLEKRVFRSDLNTKGENIISALVAYLMMATLALAVVRPGIWIAVALLCVLFLVLNRGFYLFVLREEGAGFALKAVLMNWFGYLYSGFGLVLGVLAYLRKACARVIRKGNPACKSLL